MWKKEAVKILGTLPVCKLNVRKGPIKKSELGKIRRIGPVKIYSKTQKESFFENCDPYEELRFKTLYEPAFRKKELVYLEKDAPCAIQDPLR